MPQAQSKGILQGPAQPQSGKLAWFRKPRQGYGYQGNTAAFW
jgi:hypothetical protein